MIIHLIRHGKTNQVSPSGRDYDRELLPKGRLQSEDLGTYLSLPSTCIVYCSSSVRTLQTFELINRSQQLKSVSFHEDLYLCSREHLLRFINGLNHSHDILFVGHNYGISDLASYLLDEAIEMRTGEYLSLEVDLASWKLLSRGTATLLDRYRPRVD